MEGLPAAKPWRPEEELQPTLHRSRTDAGEEVRNTQTGRKTVDLVGGSEPSSVVEVDGDRHSQEVT